MEIIYLLFGRGGGKLGKKEKSYRKKKYLRYFLPPLDQWKTENQSHTANVTVSQAIMPALCFLI